jgi:hypothetical protein
MLVYYLLSKYASAYLLLPGLLGGTPLTHDAKATKMRKHFVGAWLMCLSKIKIFISINIIIISKFNQHTINI